VKVNGSVAGGKLDYVAGFYYFFEKSDTAFATATIPPTTIPPATAGATMAADRTMINKTDAYAGYAQADYHITDALKATAGIRYTAEFKSIEFYPNATPLPKLNAPFSTADLLAQGIPTQLTAKVWTPRFALNYQATPNVLAYVTATKGFKSGGWNGRSNVAQQAVAFGPEIDWTYEAGIKSDWLDKRLRVNLNVFYNHDAQFQGASAVVDRVTNIPAFLTQNFATFKDYGVEGEITVVPVDGLNVYWVFGTNKGSYSDFTPSIVNQFALCRATQATTRTQCGSGVVTLTGDVAYPVRIPDFSSTLGFSYTFPLVGSLELTPSASWNYTTSSWVSAANTPGTLQPAHSLINAGITLRNPDQGWQISADCVNCFNKTFVVSFITFQYLNEPGRWTLKAKYTF
jgi:iron complex outermembrane receptor protein